MKPLARKLLYDLVPYNQICNCTAESIPYCPTRVCLNRGSCYNFIESGPGRFFDKVRIYCASAPTGWTEANLHSTVLSGKHWLTNSSHVVMIQALAYFSSYHVMLTDCIICVFCTNLNIYVPCVHRMQTLHLRLRR